MNLLKTTLALSLSSLLLATPFIASAETDPKAKELDVEISIGHTMIDFTKKGTAGKKASASNNNAKAPKASTKRTPPYGPVIILAK